MPSKNQLRTALRGSLNHILRGFLLCLVLSGLGACATPQVAKPVSASWEYKIEHISDSGFEDRMNVLGKQGWEMVTARRSDDNLSSPTGYEVIFKRPAQ